MAEGSSVRLRIFHVNDVYLLDNLGSVKALINESIASKDADKILFTLAGDFLAPSILSSVDGGKGMCKVLKLAGVTHVCFGNHETDLGDATLRDRIKEFITPDVNGHKGVWLNSNMLGYNSVVQLPVHDDVKITSKDGSNTRNVALLGLLLHTPKCYKTTAFNGAVKTITPVNETALSLYEKLKGDHDLVIPLTHQDLDDDRALGKTGAFPLILAGHDHDVFEEKYDNGSIMIKAGMDAQNIYVIDVVWHSKEAQKPEITYKSVKAADIKPDPETQAEIIKHNNVLKALDTAVLYKHHSPFCSKEPRFHETTWATLLSSICRDELNCDAMIFDAGCQRGFQDYPDGKFRLSDLKKELPYPTELQVIELPGKLISECIVHSRQTEGKEENAGYFHVDDACKVDPQTHELIQIAGKPLVPDQIYRIGIYETSIHGMNNHTPLLEWYANKEKPPLGAGFPTKELVIRYFCKRIWKKLPSFDQIDTDKSNFLSPDEVEAAYLKAFGDVDGDNQIDDVEREAAKLLVHSLMSTLDADKDSKITREEYYSILSN